MILMYGIATIDVFIVIFEISKESFKMSLIVPLIFVPLFVGFLFQMAINRLDKEIQSKTH